MAQWFAKGKLKEGDTFIHESIIGSTFTGRVEKVVTVGGSAGSAGSAGSHGVPGIPAIVPSVEGWAKIYGYNTITIDPEDDPYAYGFQVL
jgi:4-hydroxyproline epimerase